MRKILVLSDTHGYLDPKLFKYINAVDEVWHGGDIGALQVCTGISKLKPLKAVYGNIDGADIRASFPEDQIFFCEEVKVVMTHIGGYPGKYPSKIKDLLREHQPDLFICGHSHILKVMNDKEHHLLHMNPGAIGLQGFHTVRTALTFEIEGREIKNLSIIELGNRTSLPS
ncbi:MAG: metallophosphoesterase family protein [bacterium]|nr:metallophosphoesterase family protein [bacterium]